MPPRILEEIQGVRLYPDPGTGPRHRRECRGPGTKVLYTKENEEKRFVIVDAGMNDLVRPSYYGSYHQILPVKEEDREEIVADVVGPICESSDFLAKDRKMPRTPFR